MFPEILNSASSKSNMLLSWTHYRTLLQIEHIKDGNRNVILCHFPIAEWNAMKRGSYHVYGHIHGREDDTYFFMKGRERALNAGCMINDYEPVTLDELIVNNEKYRKQLEREN